MRRVLLATILAVILAAPTVAGPAEHIGYRGWGPRMGISSGPDQAVVGAHLDFGNFADHFRLQPNAELGIGSDRTVLALNGEFAYRFVADWDTWSPYLGGGLGLNITNRDGRRGFEDDSSTDLGASMVGGIEKNIMNGDRFFIETKIGLVDSPDLKFEVGWTFF